MNYPNIYSLFIDRVQTYRGLPQPRDAFYFRSDEQWQGISWGRFDEEVHDFAAALLVMLSCFEHRHSLQYQWIEL